MQADVAHVARNLDNGSERFRGIAVRRTPLYGHFFVGWAPGLRNAVADYDLLHVHDPQLLSLTANVMVYGGGKPAVLSTHGGFLHTRKFARFKSLHERWLMSYMLSRYRLVLASSSSDECYYSRFARNVVLAENGVDVSRFSAIRPNEDQSPWNWVYWGRLSQNKRLDQVISLAKRARMLGYPVSLVITGKDFDGTESELRAGLDPEAASFVTLYGPSSDAELSVLIRQSTVFVTASEHEGFGLSIVEAMAAGLVVICRDIPPLNGFVDGECGLLMNFDGSDLDTQKLSAFLRNFDNRRLSLRTEARTRAQRYDWSVAVKKFVKFYQETLRHAGETGVES